MELFKYVVVRNQLLNGDKELPKDLINRRIYIGLSKNQNYIQINVDQLELNAGKLFSFLSKIMLSNKIKINVSFLKNNKVDNVEKIVSSQDVEKELNELLDLPHDAVNEIFIDAKSFKLRVYNDFKSADIYIFDQSLNAVFRGIVTGLFPINVGLFKDKVEEKASFTNTDKGIEIQISELIDGENAGSKFLYI
ncbi:MAG: hypothetical protein QXL76_01455 [Candidatus Rehaiarchaeum fermentans]|nr:hypothetical protein [Candidatus Rehaiarchaeum fermentans]